MSKIKFLTKLHFENDTSKSKVTLTESPFINSESNFSFSYGEVFFNFNKLIVYKKAFC